MDDEDVLWTKVKITTHDGLELQFLEKNDDLPALEYVESPFDSPEYNVQIWEIK